MSLFLPSNLSPNFEEVNPGESFNFSFQVNTNGSCVRSYKLEILNDKNDADVPEDNILATFYGIFETPLYNKDMHTIIISDTDMNEALGDNSMITTKDYRWRIRLYEDEISSNAGNGGIIDIQTVYGSTYVGAGHTVGTTKNVIWLSQSNERIIEDKYIQTTLYSDSENNDFNPFNTKHLLKHDNYKTVFGGDTVQMGCIIQLHTNENNKIDGFEIDQNDILPEYRKKIADGNMYFVPYPISNDDSSYNTNNLPKRIIGLENTNNESLTTNCIIKIDSLQAYDNYEFKYRNEYFYRLVYIQRQQIYSVSNSIGTHQLTKIELDEPMDYNTFHNTKVETGLVSDDFDYDRVYIDPVREFDSKLVPSAYINIAYSDDQLIGTNADIYQQYLSNYKNSLACVQLTTYVSKTGECSLFSELQFMPDRNYMYQIFIVDQDSPDYNAANSSNPYKFFAGTKLIDGQVDSRYYLGGYNGDLTADYSTRDNLLSIYSNHQVGETNQFLCFIQPNSGIFEDKYKPCTLQLYNNKYQKDLYITNYNGNNEYNKNYSIDTLDDSQWLVALTYPSTQIDQQLNNQLISLIQKPQTKYKIYTNFVNSIPEAYFYYRDNKHMKFNFYDFYREDLPAEDIVDNESSQFTIIKIRDILVKCVISDITKDGHKTNRNFATIKSYRYTVSEIDPTVSLNSPDCIVKTVYDSGPIYDNRYQYGIRGLENEKYYRIQIDAEDEYGFVHTLSEDVQFKYEYDKVNDRISAEIDCEKQAIHIGFSPVKLFSGVGNINKDDSNNEYVAIDDKNGLLFESLQDSAQNKISIPNDFVMYAKFSIGEDILATEAEHPIFSVETDSTNSGTSARYEVVFDTRTYIKNKDDNMFYINDKYLHFKCGDEYCDIRSLFVDAQGNTPIYPTGFEYMLSVNNKNTAGLYVVASKDGEFNEININDLLKSGNQYKVEKTISGDAGNQTVYILSNDGNKINSQNKDYVANVELYVKLLVQQSDMQFWVSRNGEDWKNGTDQIVEV